jgi:hypothetical protein
MMSAICCFPANTGWFMYYWNDMEAAIELLNEGGPVC